MKNNQKKYKLEFILFLSILFLLAIISHRIYFRIDTTKQKTYSLSPYTLTVIDNLESAAKISWIKSDTVSSFFPSLKYLNDILLEYELAGKGKIIIEEKNVSALSDEAIKNLGIVARQIESKAVNAKTVFSIYSGLMLEYKGETRIIPFIDDIDVLEYDIARFIEEINLTLAGQDKNRTLSIIAPPNSLYDDYAFVPAWLDYAGFKINILSAPIWKASPKFKDFLLPVLAERGFVINSDLVLDLINFRIEMKEANNSNSKYINYPFWIQLTPETINRNNPIFSAYKNLQTLWPSSISLAANSDNANLKKNIPLAQTSPKAISMVENYNTEPFGNQLKLFGEIESDSKIIIATNNEEKPENNLQAIAKTKSRILVISDEYMISKAIDFTGSSYNLDFMVNCVEYIFGKDNLILLKNKQHTALPFKQFSGDRELKIFLSTILKARIFNFIVLPLCILGLGIFMIFKRKEK